ncbi:MAG: 3-hydroxyacyl-CoA dehydrogenase [Acidimicrobiia bacterium]|nr:3-hydroxyacyl-CoA dehydrogenase [Acidimicrobiia bacterium]
MTARTPIRSAAVLGAGTMGAQIAAHFANIGVPTLLLDLTEQTARDGLKRAMALKPDPLFTRGAAQLIRTGGFDDLSGLAKVDWIMEAVVERLDVKRELLARVDAARTPGTIMSSNTSGISIAAIGEGRSEDFRRHWLGTHFFNPPRYLHLLELIPTADTDQAVLERIAWFADHRLGKGVVVAKDTPNFIANHIGVYGLMQVLRALTSGAYTIEEIDAMTGPAIGRPKSATFRTMDVVGVDVLGHVARNMTERMTDPAVREMFVVPTLIEQMIERGATGEKAGQGFYKREKGASGESEILTLDTATLTYRARQSPTLASLEAAKAIEPVAERLKTLYLGKDRVGEFLRSTLGPTLLYAARVAPEIAHSIDDVDRAMRWGFGWDLGPFEIWDAIGIRSVMSSMPQNEAPALVADRLRAGHDRFRDGLPPASPDLQILKSARDRQRTVRANAGASLVDLGDGVLAVEFHSKMNAIGADTIQMLQAGVKEAAANFSALVVGTEAEAFSAGANLMLLLLEAQEGNWDEIDVMIRQFQGATMALQHAAVPVVVAPAGLALGGGCEIVLHGDRAQAAAESYIGLVEVGVGLIPAGGGTKEMLARAMEATPPSDDLFPAVQPVFETIGFGRVSTSARHAHELGYLRDVDGETMNRDRLMADAKQLAMARVREGYRPPAKRTAIPVGGETVFAALKLGIHLAWRAGRITDHDVVVGRALARILAGGELPHRTTVSEDYLLDLEREAFLKLCGERKTLERIQHTLKTGKPLRN